MSGVPDPLPAAVALRPRTGDDAPFLERLYLESRWDEASVAFWPDDTKLAFLRSQFGLQTRHYDSHYPGARFDIVELQGMPIGRLYVHRGPAEMRVVDISLLTDYRGKGIGGNLLRAVCREAGAAGQTVTLHVERFNPAQTLYRRLGFLEVKAEGPYLLMEWSP